MNSSTGPMQKASQIITNIKTSTTSGSTSSKIIKFILVILLIYFIIRLLILAFRNKKDLATPDNIQRITSSQLLSCDAQYASSQSKKGINTSFSSIPEDQKLLINASVLSCRLAGYLGPFETGVFQEDNAVRLALSSGARCLVIEIDHEEGKMEPLLIYRDGWGTKRSLNVGSIQLVAKSIAGRAFKATNDSVPPNLENDPLFVVVYFVRAPNMATNPRDYVKYLGKVAEMLQPLSDYLVGQTPQGDFRRQQLESQLFFMPYTIFSKQIILMTNADTSAFRRLETLGLKGELGPNQDLDLMTHVRLYSRESPSGLGITQVPSVNIAPSAVITTPYYWLATPPDRLLDAQAQTKKAWTLTMEPIASENNTPTKENIKKLLTEFGVQSIPFCMFDQKHIVENFTGLDSPYGKTAWSVKPELIRYIPPKPLVIQKPSPKTNAYGGSVFAPQI
jgi:hypothetical protein